MDVIEVLVKQSDEKIAQLKDYLSEGRAESFEEYKKLCVRSRVCSLHEDMH